MNRVGRYAVECALIDADNKGMSKEAAVDYAADSTKQSVDDVAEVWSFLHTMQDRIAARLNIQI